MSDSTMNPSNHEQDSQLLGFWNKSDWANMLGDTPDIITAIGHLLVLSGGPNFKLVKPSRGLVYMQLDEFVPNIHQLANQTLGVFANTRQAIGDAIVSSGRIADELSNIVKFLNDEPDALKLLPSRLDNLKSSNETAANVTHNAMKGCDSLLMLGQELREVCILTEGNLITEREKAQNQGPSDAEKILNETIRSLLQLNQTLQTLFYYLDAVNAIITDIMSSLVRHIIETGEGEAANRKEEITGWSTTGVNITKIGIQVSQFYEKIHDEHLAEGVKLVSSMINVPDEAGKAKALGEIEPHLSEWRGRSRKGIESIVNEECHKQVRDHVGTAIHAMNDIVALLSNPVPGSSGAMEDHYPHEIIQKFDEHKQKCLDELEFATSVSTAWKEHVFRRVEAIDSDSSRVDRELGEKQKKKEDLDKSLPLAKQQVTDKATEVASHQAKVNDAQNSLNDAKKEKEDYENQVFHPTPWMRFLNALSSARDREMGFRSEFARLANDVASMDAKLRAFEGERNTEQNRLKDLQTDLDAKVREEAKINREIEGLQGQVTELNLEKERLQAQRELLSALNVNSTTLQDSISSVLSGTKNIAAFHSMKNASEAIQSFGKEIRSHAEFSENLVEMDESAQEKLVDRIRKVIDVIAGPGK